MSGTGERILLVAGILSLFVVIAASFLIAPDAANFRAPLTQRIFYYHVPSAWVSYVAFAVTSAASVVTLVRRDESRRADRIAASSAEIGLLFSIIALITGLLWSREEFSNYSPLADAKVITLVALIAAYAAYLVLRANVDDPARRARLAAVFGVLAFIGVPLSYLASRLSVHPDFAAPDESLAPELGILLGVSLIGFTVLYASLLAFRVRIARAADVIREEMLS
ncbi:MAG: cytochrome c biogenesis protein CcsA [Thermoplasmatota archaeon]